MCVPIAFTLAAIIQPVYMYSASIPSYVIPIKANPIDHLPIISSCFVSLILIRNLLVSIVT